MRIKIVSDGHIIGTDIVNAETGERLDQVIKASWEADADTGFITATIVVEDVQLEIETDVDVLTTG